MSASCYFIEPSCKKVEICNPHPPGKTDRALADKMTATSFSFMFSVCFVTLLIWGCTTVVCLVNEKSLVEPTTTTGYHSTGTTNANATFLDHPLSFACGNNSHRCENFCEICNYYQGAPTMDCLSKLFDYLCLYNFESAMSSLNSTGWCLWGNVSGLYSNLSLCTEEISDCLLIPWPNPLVEQTFVNIHTRYFNACPTEELSDPQPVIVFALVITPICLIPVMVSLVVLKTKNGDGSS
ncbi:receptor activity-modifying protein 2 isoform X2 [Micropterus salmoides]|uniref:receptor activity-modifying protein 2 isoform X2 n=1 Tax=Micropterus salmoides TaxID=27706 RepID=UPI0018EAAD9D|nr:receptor activity-modifying protein 2 isoform X2 [Micropterus salmoides]